MQCISVIDSSAFELFAFELVLLSHFFVLHSTLVIIECNLLYFKKIKTTVSQ